MHANSFVHYEESSLKRLGIDLFRKILGILGCLLFLFSMILPFYHLTYFVSSMIEFQNSTYYWSFRASQEVSFFEPPRAPQHTDTWFFQPGFYNPGSSFSIYVLVVIFVAQLLTLATGIASVFHDRRLLTLAPLALCSLAIVLMTYTNTVLATTKSVFLLGYTSQVTNSTTLLGYWFTYPAVTVFLLSFILNIVSKKRSSAYTPTLTLARAIEKQVIVNFTVGLMKKLDICKRFEKQ
jgi:hypothetical protein